MRMSIPILIIVVLAGCAAPAFSPAVAPAVTVVAEAGLIPVGLDRAALCALYTGPDMSERHLLAVEAELALRGGTCTGMVLRSSSRIGSARYSRVPTQTSAPVVQGDNLNCSDFTNAAQAQRVFLSAGGPTRDPHGLDRDGDGFACEWGVARAGLWTAPPPVAASFPTRRSGGRCHVGPRGGTYTITASGRKNYGGC